VLLYCFDTVDWVPGRASGPAEQAKDEAEGDQPAKPSLHGK